MQTKSQSGVAAPHCDPTTPVPYGLNYDVYHLVSYDGDTVASRVHEPFKSPIPRPYISVWQTYDFPNQDEALKAVNKLLAAGISVYHFNDGEAVVEVTADKVALGGGHLIGLWRITCFDESGLSGEEFKQKTDAIVGTVSNWTLPEGVEFNEQEHTDYMNAYRESCSTPITLLSCPNCQALNPMGCNFCRSCDYDLKDPSQPLDTPPSASFSALFSGDAPSANLRLHPDMRYAALSKQGYMPPHMLPMGEPRTQDAVDLMDFARKRDTESRAMKCQHCEVLLDEHTRTPDGLACADASSLMESIEGQSADVQITFTDVWTCANHLTPIPDIPEGGKCPVCANVE